MQSQLIRDEAQDIVRRINMLTAKNFFEGEDEINVKLIRQRAQNIVDSISQEEE